jgi:hypothetical protein
VAPVTCQVMTASLLPTVMSDWVGSIVTLPLSTV